MTGYWIKVTSRNDVRRGIEGGFARLGEGDEHAVAPFTKDDWIVFYSPLTEPEGGDRVEAFTAIGRVTSEHAYRVKMDDGSEPYRIDVDYRNAVEEADIRSLLDKLDLTRLVGKEWSKLFDAARVKLSERDFRIIAAAMGAEPL